MHKTFTFKAFTLVLTLQIINISIVKSQGCSPLGDQVTYGTNNTWIGYVYKNSNLNGYVGYVNKGNPASANFDENFGGSNVTLTTNGCTTNTEKFSVRYRLRKSFSLNTYTITVGGDDGYRLSFDGGATWAVSNWNDHVYMTSTWTGVLNGTYNIVLEYYDNTGSNRLSIDFGANGNASSLPVSLSQFTAKQDNGSVQLDWTTSSEQNTDHFDVQRSADGRSYSTLGQVHSLSQNGNSSTPLYYGYTDKAPLSGTTSYYRLRVVDKDGTITYSNVIRMNDQGQTGLLRIYPTLADQGRIWISPGTTMKDVTVDVYSMNGARMQQQRFSQLAGGQTSSVQLRDGLPRGMYLVSVRDGYQVIATQKIIKP